jgi:hypothetical protein
MLKAPAHFASYSSPLRLSVKCPARPLIPYKCLPINQFFLFCPQKQMARLFLLAAFVCISLCVSAQSEEETLDWINVKKIDMQYAKSNTVAYDGVLEFTKELFKVSNKAGAYTNMNWSSVKEVKQKGTYEIEVVFNTTYNGQTTFINVTVYDKELRGKIQKAFMHMATLKGAKLIDSDLF